MQAERECKVMEVDSMRRGEQEEGSGTAKVLLSLSSVPMALRPASPRITHRACVLDLQWLFRAVEVPIGCARRILAELARCSVMHAMMYHRGQETWLWLWSTTVTAVDAWVGRSPSHVLGSLHAPRYAQNSRQRN